MILKPIPLELNMTSIPEPEKFHCTTLGQTDLRTVACFQTGHQYRKDDNVFPGTNEKSGLKENMRAD
ncbi:hypothetical protein SAMN05216326_1045 [Nitrosomonas marina]|uniref:Uncharacterized protein n=2 Tax=Nitrosomonas marina TaxID=917 RepID=A0A1H9ZE82_9PROT|nr:hypothetical protein SAMN05216326_1045 [Nitrosomonas marina]